VIFRLLRRPHDRDTFRNRRNGVCKPEAVSHQDALRYITRAFISRKGMSRANYRHERKTFRTAPPSTTAERFNARLQPLCGSLRAAKGARTIG